MFWFRKHKKLVIFIVLVVAALPYAVHVDQDLFYPCVSHDEAAFATNAKDIILFGPQSLAHNPLYVQFILNVLIALVSFSLFGISLATLRLPYITLNILGNIFFFDLLRRTTGRKVAVVTTILFAFYAPHIAIGKTAMVESMVLPMVIILCWMMVFMHKRPKIYLLLGLVSGLVCVTKIDNSVVLLPLFTFAFIDDLKNQRVPPFVRTKWLLSGFGIVILGWGIYAVLIGLDEIFRTFKFEFLCNLSGSYLYLSEGAYFGKSFSWDLIWNNLLKLWDWYPLFVIMICVSGFAMMMLVPKKSSSYRDPLVRAIILLLVLFISKIVLTTYLVGGNRIPPCFPLPFLALAYVCVNWQRLRGWANRVIILAGICILFFAFPFIKRALYETYDIILYPTHRIIESVERMRKVLDPRFRVGYYDCAFTYSALSLPNMFYDLERIGHMIRIPAIIKNEQIAYLMVKPENKSMAKFAESIPGSQLIMTDALPPERGERGYVYRIQWYNIDENRYKEAEEMYRKAIEPEWYERHNNLGWLYNEENRYEEAEETFKRAIVINPENYEAYVGLGECYRNQGRDEEAEKIFQKAIEINPENYEAYIGLGECYRNQGRDEEAEKIFQKAIEINPENYEAYIELGECYRNQGRDEEAEKIFQKARAKNPKNN